MSHQQTRAGPNGLPFVVEVVQAHHFEDYNGVASAGRIAGAAKEMS